MKRKKQKYDFKKFKKRYSPRVMKFTNIFLAVGLFSLFISSAFSISFIFGMTFVIGFSISIYNDNLKRKPWKPIAIFVGALITRLAIGQYLNPVVEAKTIIDLSISLLVFAGILLVGWKVKRS